MVDRFLKKVYPTLTSIGDIIYANVFGQPLVIVNSVEITKELLVKRSSIYSDRPHFVRFLSDDTLLLVYYPRQVMACELYKQHFLLCSRTKPTCQVLDSTRGLCYCPMEISGGTNVN